jgi:hypothetical protein
MNLKSRTWLSVAVLALVAALALSACGSSKKKYGTSGAASESTLALTIAESGKAAKYTVPATAKGGLTKLTFANNGKAPHGAQLARIIGNHTPQEVFKIIGSGNKVPEWLRAAGGLGPVPPGGSATATLNLDAGRYMVFDPPNGPPKGGPPAFAQFAVTAGTPAPLPSTPTTVTADRVAKDKYRWVVAGVLKSGRQDITFVSKGKTGLHHINAFRVTGNPSKAEILKAATSNGPPPKFVDQKSFTGTAVLDGEKSQVTPLSLTGAGEWVLVCYLKDRDGGKEHSREGLLQTVQVK